MFRWGSWGSQWFPFVNFAGSIISGVFGMKKSGRI
jgi:hypothetical protein